MTRLSPPRGLFRSALLFAAVLTAACGDGVLPPRAVAGYYRLVTINGQPLPYVSPPSLGLGVVQVWRGDLLLRPNGTFVSGVGGNIGFGFIAEGSYRFSGGEVLLEMDGGPATNDGAGRMAGDSITFVSESSLGQPLTFTYRRAQPGPSTVASAPYRLRSINGRTAEPIVAHDTTIGDTRYVATVLFDSVTFSDGVFFRRHRSESAITYIGGQPGLVSAEEWTTGGAYESGPGWVVLLHYSPPSLSIRARDSLSIASDTLIRRTTLITGTLEERYVR